ncbi:alpha/beta fold hydrolase [Pseudonocardia sp. DSM 110487]|uniref:alpha/beta fold hydrolase n=1 Tax=Pseudonocardia sp. DSM 110487 TaxID=2865833 RepID=UPI001C6A11B0|nr:alpha/beta fold hydrolase [Pseudonocardia sp. DSM 110487]QYN38901.1 alpha/beta fold hydrolase [Pseudonocardia sp. DSM 110487]
MTSSPPRSHTQHMAFLAGAAAVNAVHSLAEITRASGNLFAGTLAGTATRAAHPVGLVTHGVRWVGTMAQRRQPEWHLPHRTVLRTPFAHVHDFSPAGADHGVVPTLVLPPQAGHSSHVVDFAPGQSQLAVILDAGLTRLYAMEWRAATAETRDVTITDYLDVVDRAIVLAGGRVNLVGDCQGGWLAAIYAALHPERVHTLTLAGAPIDFHAGESVIAASTRVLTHGLGMAPYRALVALNGGNMSGRAVLANFIAMQPQAEIGRQLQLLAHLDDPAHVERYRVFEDWFKHTQDIPGAFYLWLVEHLFHGNELIDGRLIVAGCRADLANITCPLFLLAGARDHITPPPQLFAAADVVGTPPSDVVQRTAEGGHLGLFTGSRALEDDWPVLMADVYAHSTSGLARGA